MKIDTTLFLLLVGSSHGISFLRGDNNNIHNGRELMDDHSMFDRLMCNSAYSACESWSSQNYDLSSPVTIPCGTCVEMDATGTVALAGLNVEGKLVISSPVEIHTPYVLVQGDLDMSSDRPTNGTPDIKFVLTGDGVVSLAPHEDNTSRCEGGVCSFGKKPFAIAGGTLNVRGLPESCPTWTTLKNVQSSGPASGNAGPSYISPAPGCSDALVDTDFEDPMDSAWPDGWYRNYGGTDYTETDANGNNCRVYGGRTSSWNGPQLNWPAECVVPGPTYFISAKAMLRRPDGNPSNCASTGFNCLKITSFREDTGLGKSWNNRGTSGSHPDNEWFTFISTTVFDDIFDDADTALARRFFWEGPEAGVEIILDDIRIFRLPEEMFADPSTNSNACAELLINGNAEDPTMHPFTYPYSRTQGSSVLTLEEEELNGENNHYYHLTNRAYGWASLSYHLPTSCISADSVYSITADIRVHSSTPKSFRYQLTVINADGSKSWPWLGSCAPQTIDDGWVTCFSSYQFDATQGTSTELKLYLVSDDSTHDDLDVDNMSISFQSGPVKSLVLPDSTGDISSCWGPGSQLLVTSNNLDFDDVATPTIASVTNNPTDQTTTVELVEPIEMTSYSDNEPDYAVEVALLSRNIVMESSDTENPVNGGHLIFYHTTHAQFLDGVEFRKFGQAGMLGKYPVHFHMCGSAEGSIVSRNLVRESNQRCYVIHGTHNVTLDSNIAYDTFGHCFMLEDHAERDNILVDNLAAVTRKAVTVISSDETDDFCSSFWITNTENTFVGNVAAGSEHSGFWFEMESFVRGPSAMMPENNGYQPHKAPLTLFSENVAHSNDEHGVKTYPGTGYDPVEEQTFYKTKSYRNAGNGVFIHNSENIKIQGGLFADNRIQVDIDRSPTCTIDGALIVGYSPEFRNIRETTYSRGHCPSDWPIRGVEIHTYWTGGNKYTGTDISNTSFENFGNTGCADSSAIRVDEEDRGYFDIRTQVSGVVFDADSPPLSACDAIASGVDNFAMRDVDGSIMEVPGFIVADTPRMTTFGDCVSDPDSCTATCADQCFRAVVLAVSSLEDDSLALEVTDIASGTTLSFLGHYEYPLNADGSLNIAENTKTHRSRMFFAVLPSGGGYSATFVKNGAPYWPVYVHSDYDDPDSTCPELSSLEIVEPNDENCNELIKNGDMEAGIEGWSATMGGLLSVDESASGQGLALTNEYRTAYWMAPAQYLDTRCMVEGTHYSVSAKAKLVSKSTGAPVDCNAAAGMCPKLIVKVESGAHEKYDEYWHLIASPPATWVAEDWNTLSGYLIVHSHLASAGSILVYFESNTVNGGDAMLYVDDVSIVPASSSS